MTRQKNKQIGLLINPHAASIIVENQKLAGAVGLAGDWRRVRF
ncbi:hypothetical protein [Xenorhabdus innexi]|nr:hypothetical protein [Xenorhabdus innexi]